MTSFYWAPSLSRYSTVIRNLAASVAGINGYTSWEEMFRHLENAGYPHEPIRDSMGTYIGFSVADEDAIILNLKYGSE